MSRSCRQSRGTFRRARGHICPHTGFDATSLPRPLRKHAWMSVRHAVAMPIVTEPGGCREDVILHKSLKKHSSLQDPQILRNLMSSIVSFSACQLYAPLKTDSGLLTATSRLRYGPTSMSAPLSAAPYTETTLFRSYHGAPLFVLS